MPTPKLGKGLGRRRDYHDARDIPLPRTLHQTLEVLPAHVDLFEAIVPLPVYDQGELGSCTANVGALYRRWLARRFPHVSAPDIDLSRLFLYYQERLLDGTVSQDAGSGTREIFYVLAHKGICPEHFDPYTIDKFADVDWNTTNYALTAAEKFKIGAYHRITSLEGIKSCLASGYPVALGFTVYESFEDIGTDGTMPMPDREQILGGHEVFVYGYDDATHTRAFGASGGSGLLKIQNSWGAEWGDAGHFYMPYEFIESADISQWDAWMGHLGKPWKPN